MSVIVLGKINANCMAKDIILLFLCHFPRNVMVGPGPAELAPRSAPRAGSRVGLGFGLGDSHGQDHGVSVTVIMNADRRTPVPAAAVSGGPGPRRGATVTVSGGRAGPGHWHPEAWNARRRPGGGLASYGRAKASVTDRHGVSPKLKAGPAGP